MDAAMQSRAASYNRIAAALLPTIDALAAGNPQRASAPLRPPAVPCDSEVRA